MIIAIKFFMGRTAEGDLNLVKNINNRLVSWGLFVLLPVPPFCHFLGDHNARGSMEVAKGE